MQNKSVLQNPSIAETVDRDTVEPAGAVPRNTKPRYQQPLPIYEPRDWRSYLNRKLRIFRFWLKRREEILELIPFWRTEASAFAIVSSLLINIGIFVYNIVKFAEFPPQTRLFFDHAQNTPILVDKSLLLAAPIAILLIEVILLRLVFDLFKLDKQLSQTASWLITAINIMILIAALQIYSLSL